MKIMLRALVVIIIIVGLFVGANYVNYTRGNRSHIFGTIDSYNQNQTLHIYNLDARVTKSDIRPYKKPELTKGIINCQLEQKKLDSEPPSPGNPFPGLSLNQLCVSVLADYNLALTYYSNKYESWRVDFSYQNVSNHPINMKNYNFSLIANTQLNDLGNCTIQKGDILPGPALNSCLWADISNSYAGPMSLVVKSGHLQKTIQIEQK